MVTPSCSVIDTHVHFWAAGRIRYPWLNGNALLDQRFLVDDYKKDFAGVPVGAMVFVQSEAEFSAYAQEASCMAELAVVDPRIKAMVVWAPLEKGCAVEKDLAVLKRYAILRGIRPIIQFEDDVDFCLRPAFIEGVRTLAQHQLSLDS